MDGAKTLFSLGPRLALCGSLVRPGQGLIDVGTDHAYLPIWLLKSGIIPRATASDINQGPLDAARRHAAQYGVGEELRLVKSDGLRGLAPEDGSNVVIAGMGGELILRIIGEMPWLRDPEIRLILQPMTQMEKLRLGLLELGFRVTEEHAAQENGKAYTAFAVEYIGMAEDPGLLYPYMGRLSPQEPAARAYAEKVLGDLANRLRGAKYSGDQAQSQMLEEAIEGIQRTYLKGEKYGENL